MIAIDGLVLFVLARSWRIGSSYNSTIAIHALVHGRNGEECDQHGRLTLIQPRTQRGAERLELFRSVRTLHTIERLHVESHTPHHDAEALRSAEAAVLGTASPRSDHLAQGGRVAITVLDAFNVLTL